MLLTGWAPPVTPGSLCAERAGQLLPSGAACVRPVPSVQCLGDFPKKGAHFGVLLAWSTGDSTGPVTQA